MFVGKEGGAIAESWSPPQIGMQSVLGEAHPDWLRNDHLDAVVRLASSAPTAPPSIPNWKAHGIPTFGGKRQVVLDLIGAIVNPMKRELILSTLLRLDPLSRDSATLVKLLTHPTVSNDNYRRSLRVWQCAAIHPGLSDDRSIVD